MKWILVILSTFLFSVIANASFYFNQRMAVQGYLKNGGTPLTSGTYNMRFIIKRAGTAVWTKSYTGGAKVAVSDGMFSQILSGADDSTVTLTSNLLDVTTNTTAITIDVVVDLDGDGLGVGTDSTFANLDIVPTPMSLLSRHATNLTQNGATQGQYLMWNNTNGRWEPAEVAVPAGSIATGALADSSVTSLKIANASVTAAKLATSAVDLGSSVVTGINSAANGGTGHGTFAAGDLLYASGTASLARRTVGTNGQVLTVTAGLPTWETPTLTVATNNIWSGTNQFSGGLTAGSTITGGSAMTQMKVCSGTIAGAFNVATAGAGITQTLSCTGVATSMAVSCSPTGAPTLVNNPWWVAWVSAANTISIRVTSTAVAGTEVAANSNWRCLVYQ